MLIKFVSKNLLVKRQRINYIYYSLYSRIQKIENDPANHKSIKFILGLDLSIKIVLMVYEKNVNVNEIKSRKL